MPIVARNCPTTYAAKALPRISLNALAALPAAIGFECSVSLVMAS
jgi:hypothetical protein